MARGWPHEALTDYLSGRHDDALRLEKETVRRRLLDAVPDDGRSLLFRASLVLGHFPREIALALGRVAPAVARPGEVLDQLIGPWIDALGPDELRVSPLVGDAGGRTLDAVEQGEVHKAIVETLMRSKQINVNRVDAVFLHALLGKVDSALFGLSASVLTADEKTRRMLAERSTVLRLLRVDRPAYPEQPTISKMLRLAQFELVVAKGNDNVVRNCARALLREAGGRPRNAADRTFEGLVLVKLLTERRISGEDPVWSEVDAALEKELKGAPTTLGFMFITQCLVLGSVASLSVLFDRLDGLDGERRSKLLGSLLAAPGDFSLIVKTPWFVESRRASLDGLDAAERYLRMAGQAAAWGERILALRCHVARGVMLDEYSMDPRQGFLAAAGSRGRVATA